MKAKLKRGILLVLAAWESPMPESGLVSAVQSHARPSQPTSADVMEALRDCEAGGFVSGMTDDFSQERAWGLTEKGRFKAREVR